MAKRRRTKSRRRVKAYSAPRRRVPARRRRKKTRAYSAAPKRRVSARRRRRNPRGIMGQPAVELGIAAMSGAALGAAADAAPKPSWLTTSAITQGQIVGLVLGVAGWNLAKGRWRQRLVAAGIGAAGFSFVTNTVAPALAGMFGNGNGNGNGNDAFPSNRNVRFIAPSGAPMASQHAALAANGIPV